MRILCVAVLFPVAALAAFACAQGDGEQDAPARAAVSPNPSPPPTQCVLSFSTTRPAQVQQLPTPFACFLFCRASSAPAAEKSACTIGGREVFDFLTAASPDTDGDGAPDAVELSRGTLIDQRDSDRDGMEDGWEQFYAKIAGITGGLGAAQDTDLDGRSNLDEFLLGTNPLVADTDSFTGVALPSGAWAYALFGRASALYELDVQPTGGSWSVHETFSGADRIVDVPVTANARYRFVNSSVWISATQAARPTTIPAADRFYALGVPGGGAPEVQFDQLLRSLQPGGSRALPTLGGQTLPAVIHLMSGVFTTVGRYQAPFVDTAAIGSGWAHCVRGPDWVDCWKKLNVTQPNYLSNEGTQWLLQSQWTLRGAGRYQPSSGSGTLLELARTRPELSQVSLPLATDLSRITMIANPLAGSPSNSRVRDLSLYGRYSQINRQVGTVVSATITHPLKILVAGVNLRGSNSTVENVEFRDFGTDNFWTMPAHEPWWTSLYHSPGELFVAWVGGRTSPGTQESYSGIRISGCDYFGGDSLGLSPSDHRHGSTIFMVTGGWVGRWEFERDQGANYVPGQMNPLRGAELIGNRCILSRRPAELSGDRVPTGFSIDEIRATLAESGAHCLSMYETEGGLVRDNLTQNTPSSFWGDTVKAKGVVVDRNVFRDTRAGVSLRVAGAHNSSYEDFVITRNDISINVWSREDHKWAVGIELGGLPRLWNWFPVDEQLPSYRGIRNVTIRNNRVSVSPNNGDALTGTPLPSNRALVGIFAHSVTGPLIIEYNHLDDRIPEASGDSGRIIMVESRGIDGATGNMLFDRAVGQLALRGNDSFTAQGAVPLPRLRSQVYAYTAKTGDCVTRDSCYPFLMLGRTSDESHVKMSDELVTIP